MNVLDPACERVPQEQPEDRRRLFEQAGVIASLENPMMFPFVRDAVESGCLSPHGARFDIGTGMRHIFDPERGGFCPVERVFAKFAW